NKINELTKKRSLLVSALESNMIDLKEAQAIAATQPSEMSKNKVKELLLERTALTSCLEANEQELQPAKCQEAVLMEKVKHEEEVNELSEKRRMLLEELEKNLNDLQEAQTLAAIEPSSENDEKIKELTEQRELLAANLDSNLQDLERAQAYVPGLGEEKRLKQEEINELSEKKKTLLDNLKSNLKDLEEAQALAAIESSTMNDEKIKELTEQRKLLAASLDTILQDLQRAQGYVPGLGDESRLKELKLHELIEERKHLTAELEGAVHVIQGIQREQELKEVSQKKQLLLKNLESNLKDLKEAQTFAAAEPGSITEQKLQELTEQRRHLAADLDATLNHIEELQHQDEIVKTPEVELQELSDKKQLILGKLDSTLKELQQAQALASAEAGGVSEQKLQELTEQKRQLTAELESAILDMQEIQHRDEILKSSEKEMQKLLEKKHLLLENLASTVKELQEAQAAVAAQPGSISEANLQVIREKGRRLTSDLETIAHDIKKAQHRASGRAELVTPGEQELRDLSEKKQSLLQNLTSNLKELEQVQALAGSQPGSFTEDQIQQLTEQRKLLTASLDKIIHQIKEVEDRRVQETPKMPVGLKMDLNQLFEHKKLFLEGLESNLKDLQEAQALAATHPGSVTERGSREKARGREAPAIDEQASNQKAWEGPWERGVWVEGDWAVTFSIPGGTLNLKGMTLNLKCMPRGGGTSDAQKIQKLTEERRLLAAGLKAITEEIEGVESQELDKDAIMRTREIILEELYQKQRLILENLDSNWKDLQEAEAAAQPGGMGESGLAELSENRKQLWKNVELNLNDLKGLQDLALSEPDGMQEEKKQMLAEQRKHLAANLEALLQDIEEAQNLVLSGSQMSSTDGE
ncbi:UNVERIFIED_CONTAM: hypothetical protein K2H54_023182, partial [Gekko kuhli]